MSDYKRGYRDGYTMAVNDLRNIEQTEGVFDRLLTQLEEDLEAIDE